MGGHGGLNILPQKRWNVYNYENREKVRRDEEAAAKEEQLKREQSLKRDAESRLEKLRLARGLAPPIQAAESSGSDSKSKSKSKSGHINLFEGLKVFDPVRGDGEDEGIAQKRKKMKKEEAPKVVLPEDEKYRLGYGLAGKGVKLPWYLSRPSDDGLTENRKEGGSERLVKEEAKNSGKKSLEELRKERLKRERREKERERALLSEKTPRNGPFSRSTGFSRRSSRGGTERDEELELVREELREVQRELRETKQMMRSQGSGRFRGTRTQEDSSHSQRRPHSTKSGMSQMEAMKRFMVMQPPSFTGEPDAEVAENWLRSIRRILDGLDIPGVRRVSLAVYMLVDRADFWWETMKQVYKTETMTWDQFERIFLDKYVGEVAKHTKRMEC